MRVRVEKDARGDWVAHDDHMHVTCTDWLMAMEAAYGHIAMGHSDE